MAKFVLLFTSLALLSTNINFTRNIVDNELLTYDIHPLVHSIEYSNDLITIPNKIELDASITLDEYTIEEAYNVIGLKPILMSEENGFSDFKLSISTYTGDDEHFDKLDAYTLDIKENEIEIVGKNNDACFYALQTVREILNQSTTSLRALSIKDYSSSLYRGVIEGFYGVTYNSYEIMDMIDFLSYYKGNSFFYGPRHDAYFRTAWRDLLPEDEVRMLKDIVEHSKKRHVNYYFGCNPVETKSFEMENYDADIKVLLAKFEQAYSVGVRNFFISADDVAGETVNVQMQIKFMNDIAAWAKNKGDIGRIALTPSCYCADGGDILGITTGYLNALRGSLDETIDVFWTGEKITSNISNGAFDTFKEYTGMKPIFWLNWPVNDYAPEKIIMSKAEMLDINYQEGDDIPFLGVISNPGSFAYPSLLAIYQCLDYSWNVVDYDIDDVYDSCFPRLEENEPEALKHICSYLANANKYLDGSRYFEESPHLSNLINEYKSAKENSLDTTNIEAEIVEELEYTKDCVDKLLTNGANDNFLEQLKPYMLAVVDTCDAVKPYFDLDKVVAAKDKENILDALNKAFDAYDKIDDNEAVILDYVTNNETPKPVQVCNAVLTPFLNELKLELDYQGKLLAGLPTGIIYRGIDGIYSGEESDMFDGDEDSYVLLNGHAINDSYIQIDLESIQTIDSLKLVYKDHRNADCYFTHVEISEDGYEYYPLATQNSNILELDLRDAPISARFLRLANRSGYQLPWWPSVAEIKINYISQDQIKINTSGINGVYRGSNEYIFDGNTETYIWYNDYPAKDAYIEIDYRTIQEVSSLDVIYQDGNYGNAYMTAIEYSTDGKTFYKLANNYDNTFSMTFDETISFRYLRLTNDTGEGLPHWVSLAEVRLNDTTPFVSFTDGFERVYSGKYFEMFDNDIESYVWFIGYPSIDDYILIDFVNELSTNKIDVIFKNGYSIDESPAYMPLIEYSLDGKTYYQLGETDWNTFTYEGEAINFRYLRFGNNLQEALPHWVSIADIIIY